MVMPPTAVAPVSAALAATSSPMAANPAGSNVARLASM